MKPEKIEFTAEEAQAMLNILDATVKSIGLQDGGITAKNAAYFLTKFQEAFKPKAPVEERNKVLKVTKKK